MLTVVDYLFLGFGVALTVICAKRGLLLSLIKFFRLILSAVAAHTWGGAFAAFVGEKFLNAPIRASIYEKVNATYQNTAGGMGTDISLSMLPKFLQTDSMREKLSEADGTSEALVNSITDTIAEEYSAVVCGVIGYVLVFVAVCLAFSVAYVLIRNARRSFHAFGTVDTVCGGLLGVAFAWIVLLFAGSVLKFFFGNQSVYSDSTVARYFGEWASTVGFDFLNLNQWLSNLTSSI